MAMTEPFVLWCCHPSIQWAVGHLSNISDSGIYKTLSISKVLAAETQVGRKWPEAMHGG